MCVVWIVSIVCCWCCFCWCGGWLIWLRVAFIMADEIAMIDMIDVIKVSYASDGCICSIVTDTSCVPVTCKNTSSSSALPGNGSSLYAFKPCRKGGFCMYSYSMPLKNVSGREGPLAGVRPVSPRRGSSCYLNGIVPCGRPSGFSTQGVFLLFERY